MPLFRCSRCGCVDNTALGNFWTAPKGQAKCSECDQGQWHGRFTKKPAEGYFIDAQGHLWSPAEFAKGTIPPNAGLIGRLNADGTIAPLEAPTAPGGSDEQ